MIQYTANLEDSDREPLGNLFRNVDAQVIVEDGTVKKQAVFAETVSSLEGYTIRVPDSDRVKVTATEYLAGKRDEPRDYYYTFEGWQIEGTDKVISSNDKLEEVIGNNVAIVKLNAKWKALDNQKRPNTVNFYLSLSCEIMDNVGNGFNGQAKENFTTTIYSTRIMGTDGLQVKEGTDPDPQVFRILAPASNESLAYQNDSIMRAAPNKPITSKTTDAIISGNELMLEDFPSDETVLNELRRRVADPEDETTITIEGKKITKDYADYLTTEYFAIRWYVLKYNNADAWHIDGVLVAKRAHAVITKTFAGDKEAIAEVKKNYQISITHDDINGGGTQQDYVLTLNSADKEDRTNHFGYTSYDEATDTYTWVLTGRQGRTYTAKEMNYTTPDVYRSLDGSYLCIQQFA